MNLKDKAGQTGQELFDETLKEHDLSVLNELCAHLSANDIPSFKLKQLIQADYFVRPYQSVQNEVDLLDGFETFSSGVKEVCHSHFFNNLLVAGLEQRQHHLVNYLLKTDLASPNAVIGDYVIQAAGKTVIDSYQTMAHIAILNDNMLGLALLRNYGANFSIANDHNLTPYQLAKKMDKLIEFNQRKEKNLPVIEDSPHYAKAVKSLIRDEFEKIQVGNDIFKIPVVAFYTDNEMTQKGYFGEDAIKLDWEELDTKLKAPYMPALEVLAEASKLRSYNEPNAETDVLTLPNWVALVAIQNGYTNISNYMIESNLTDNDFVAQTEMSVPVKARAEMNAENGGIPESENPYLLVFANEVKIGKQILASKASEKITEEWMRKRDTNQR